MKINCDIIKTKQQLHEYIACELSFPEYYGKNLDALYDVLRTRFAETLIEIENFDSLKDSFGTYAEAFLDALQDAAENNRYIKVIML